MNKIDELKNIFEIHNNKIKAIDNKTLILLTVNAFLITAISFLHQIIFRWSIITIIILLAISLIFFILSIFPIIWNKHEKNKNNSLHLPRLWKCKDLNSIKNLVDIAVDEMNYLTQIKRISEITKIKYILLWAGIILLLVAIIIFIVSIVLSLV